MLRLVVLVLLLANLGYYAWTAGHLSGLVSISPTQSEPERLQRQVRPEVMQFDGAAPPVPIPIPAPSPAPAAPASPAAGAPSTAEAATQAGAGARV